MDTIFRFRNYLVILLTVVCIGFVFGEDWPQWRGPNYDGISMETDWDPSVLSEDSVIWEAQIGIGFSAVSVAHGRAYTAGNVDKDTDIIYCFNAENGKQLWSFKYPEPLTANLYEGGPNATPTVNDGKVYMISKSGTAFCLDADTGREIWKRSLSYEKPKWGFAGSPVIVNDWVIYNAGSAGIALNKQTGEVIWQSEDDKSGYASPVPFKKDGIQYIAMFGAESIQIIEALTGNLISSYPWKTSYDVNAADPVISGDEILITSGYNRGAALLKFGDQGLNTVWENKNMRSQMSGPVLIDGSLYGFDDNALVCLDWKTGRQKWKERSPRKGAISAAGDKLIVMGERGTLFIAEATPEGYRQISSAQVLDGRCWTMPVLSNGRIYVRNAKGRLVCVDVRKKSQTANSPNPKSTTANWPQWQGPGRDNISTETGLLKQWPQGGPEMIWSVNGIGHGYSSPSIMNGKIYITGMVEDTGILTCLGVDGNKLWQSEYGPEWRRNFASTRCTPTVIDEHVYVISGTGQVACFRADNGERVWLVDAFGQFEGQYPRFGFAESPLIIGDKVIITVGGKKALLAALNKKDGTTVWTTPANGDASAYCSPISFEWANKTMIVTMTENHIVGVDAETGALLFSYPVLNYVEKNKGIHPNTPIVKEGRIFVSSGYDMGAVQLKLSADATEVEKVWVNSEFDNHHGGIVLVDNKLYGANWQSNRQGQWMCVDWDTGETLYEHNWNNKGSLTYADGMLYCYEEGSGMVGLVKAAPQGFKPVSTFEIELGEKEHWTHPVICGKRLYIRHGDVLMAFDVAE